MVLRSRAPALGLALSALVATQACTQPREQSAASTPSTVGGQCRQRIVVSFANDSDPDVVAALASSTGTELNVVNRLLPTTYVIDLAAQDCATALQKLRAAVGVRSVEPDARRLPHQG